MRLEVNTKYLFVCLDFILLALVLLKLLRKSKPESSPKSPSRGLGHLPGTWLSRFTSLGPLLALLRLRKAPYIESLFEQYGDVVRVGPNQVAFRDTGVLKEVYGFSGKFSKSPFFQMLQMHVLLIYASEGIIDITSRNGGDHAFTTVLHAEHSPKRKALIGFYTISNLLRFTGRMMNPINKLIQGILEIRGSKSIEVIGMTKHLLTDITTDVVMGSGCGAVESWLEGNENKLSRLIGFYSRKGLVNGLLPSPLWKLLEMVPIDAVREFVYADKIVGRIIAPEVTRALDQAKLREAEGTVTNEPSNCFMDYLAQHRLSMTDFEVLCEVVGHIIASTETTAMLISYVLYYISTPLPVRSKEGIPIKPNRIQERLFAELSHRKDTDGQYYHDIDSSPYLEAVIKEGLRLRGSFPSLQLRVVPPGKALSIQGYWVPEGTELGVQAWSMHRRRTVWDKPYEFIPERWLPSDLGGWGPEPGSDSFNEMNRHFIPFGLGTRACAGRNMGMIVTKLIIASLVLQFDVKIDEKELDVKKMEPRDTHVFIFPESRECNLTLVPRE